MRNFARIGGIRPITQVFGRPLKVNEKVEAEQINRLKEIKRVRDNRKVAQTLNNLRLACKTDRNVMPYVIEAVKEYATEQEICDVYREVFGGYQDPGFY